MGANLISQPLFAIILCPNMLLLVCATENGFIDRPEDWGVGNFILYWR